MDIDADIRWLIGLVVSVFLFLGGTLIAAFRNLTGKISTGNKDIYEKMDDNRRDANTKIDEVKEKYVRRDDLDSHVHRIETNIKELRDEQRDQHKQVMDVITAAVSRP